MTMAAVLKHRPNAAERRKAAKRKGLLMTPEHRAKVIITTLDMPSPTQTPEGYIERIAVMGYTLFQQYKGMPDPDRAATFDMEVFLPEDDNPQLNRAPSLDSIRAFLADWIGQLPGEARYDIIEGPTATRESYRVRVQYMRYDPVRHVFAA